MPKNKGNKSLMKRIRISKTGMIRHRSANHKHLRSGKGGKRLRQLRKDPLMSNADAKRFEKLLFRRLRGRDQSRAVLRRSPSPAERRAAKAAAAAPAAKTTTTKTGSTKSAGGKTATAKAGA